MPGAVYNRVMDPIGTVSKFVLRVIGADDFMKTPPPEMVVSDRGYKVAIFSNQLSAMINSGVPLIRALEVIGEQTEDRKFGFVIEEVQSKITKGYTFSKSLSLYNQIFPPVFFHLVSAGENTGRLAKVLARLAELLERENQLVRSIRGALSYPIFVLCLTFVLTIGLFTTVLPSFADFYKDFDIQLPLITSTIIAITQWCRSPWFWVFVSLTLALIFWLFKRSWNIPEHRLAIYRLLDMVPLLGDILKLGALARFNWVLQLTTEAGMGIIKAIRLAALSSGHPMVEADSGRLIDGITAGDTLSEIMAFRPGLYPTVMLQMVRLGEETSTVGEACGRLGEWFEDDVQSRIEAFKAALEPLLMTAISCVVGTIVIAVFLPLYGLLEKLGTG